MSNSANDNRLFDHKMHLDNPVKLDESHFNALMELVTSVFIKYLNYACKIT